MCGGNKVMIVNNGSDSKVMVHDGSEDKEVVMRVGGEDKEVVMHDGSNSKVMMSDGSNNTTTTRILTLKQLPSLRWFSAGEKAFSHVECVELESGRARGL